MNKPSICIISHNAYGTIAGRKNGFIGGIEWQTTLTARWLAQQGYPVSLLTWDEGGAAEESIDGVRVIKICKQSGGVRGLRFFHPKWTGLARAMRRADADVYYQNGAECVTGQVAWWCRRNRRAFVFSVASNADCETKPDVMSSAWERALYRYGLRHAHRRITQTETQRACLREHYHHESVVIPMPCVEAGPASAAPREVAAPARVLWVGRVCKVKRPDRLLELARLCPELGFDMVGPAYDDPYVDDVMRQVRSVANLTPQGPLPRERLADFYGRALCLCCTSDYEGFPNTFLEAWSCGLPVVSNFDPDGLIVRQRLGLVAQDVENLAAAIRRLLAERDLYRQLSENARRYFVENHRAEVVLPRFERIFLEAAAQATQRPN